MWSSLKRTPKPDDIDERIAAGRKILFDAAQSTTSDMAQFVSRKLKEGLEEALKLFETLINDAVLICDLSGHVRACNPAAQKIFMYDANEMTDRSVLDLFRDQNRIIADPKDLWDALNDTAVHKINGVRKNGQIFLTEIGTNHLGTADGHATMLMLVRDKTEINNLRRQSDEARQRYQSLLDLCLDGVVIIQHDKIVTANKNAEQIFGVHPGQLMKATFASLLNKEERNKLSYVPGNVVTAKAHKKDGTALSLSLSGSRIVWDDHPALLMMVHDLKNI
jgi:PAS domain S-box-containing protein